MQKIFSQNIIFLSSNKKQKRLIYLNNCNLNIIKIAQYIFDYNFNIQENTQTQEQEKKQKRKQEK